MDWRWLVLPINEEASNLLTDNLSPDYYRWKRCKSKRWKITTTSTRPASWRPASDDNGDDLIQLMWWCFLPASSHYLPLPSSSIASVRLIQMIVWDHCGPFYNDHSLPIKYILLSSIPPFLRSWWSWLMMAVACGCVVTHTSLNMFHFPIKKYESRQCLLDIREFLPPRTPKFTPITWYRDLFLRWKIFREIIWGYCWNGCWFCKKEKEKATFHYLYKGDFSPRNWLL